MSEKVEASWRHGEGSAAFKDVQARRVEVASIIKCSEKVGRKKTHGRCLKRASVDPRYQGGLRLTTDWPIWFLSLMRLFARVT